MRNSTQKVRLIDIAQTAGVSRFTVAKVLLGSGGSVIRVSDKTAEKIRKIAKEMGYRPNVAARMLKGVDSKIVAVFIDSETSVVDFMIIASLERELTARGLRMMVVQTHENPSLIKEHVNDLRARGVEDAICLSHEYPNMAKEVACRMLEFSRTVFLNKPASPKGRYVSIDHANSMENVVDYLTKQKRKRLALVLQDLTYPGNIERKKGFQKALRKRKMSTNCLIWVPKDKIPGFEAQQMSVETANLIIDEVVEKNQSEAIITPIDDWAAMLLRTLTVRGYSSPDDVAIIGYGNSRLSQLTLPAITTLDPKPTIIARALAHALNDENAANQRIVDTILPTLVIRD